MPTGTFYCTPADADQFFAAKIRVVEYAIVVLAAEQCSIDASVRLRTSRSRALFPGTGTARPPDASRAGVRASSLSEPEVVSLCRQRPVSLADDRRTLCPIEGACRAFNPEPYSARPTRPLVHRPARDWASCRRRPISPAPITPSFGVVGRGRSSGFCLLGRLLRGPLL